METDVSESDVFRERQGGDNGEVSPKTYGQAVNDSAWRESMMDKIQALRNDILPVLRSAELDGRAGSKWSLRSTSQGRCVHLFICASVSMCLDAEPGRLDVDFVLAQHWRHKNRAL